MIGYLSRHYSAILAARDSPFCPSRKWCFFFRIRYPLLIKLARSRLLDICLVLFLRVMVSNTPQRNDSAIIPTSWLKLLVNIQYVREQAHLLATHAREAIYTRERSNPAGRSLGRKRQTQACSTAIVWPTFSKQGLILRQILMSICRTLFSSNLARILASPDMASSVISSSKSSLSSIPAIMADKIVVEYFSN